MSILEAGISYFGGERTNAANRDQARENRNWQEKMSNSAHQREVRDLRLAGLNPILSATGGSGASTPSGGAAQMEDSLSKAVTSGLEARRVRKEEEQMESQTKLNEKTGKVQDAQAKKTLAETALTEAITGSARAKAKFEENWNSLKNNVLEAGLNTGKKVQKFLGQDKETQDGVKKWNDRINAIKQKRKD